MTPLLLIHGPISAYTKLVFADAQAAIQKGLIKGCVLSTYKPQAQEALQAWGGQRAGLIEAFCDDITNPGFANINRQINMVRNGLSKIEAPETIVIKLRTDQRVNFKKLCKLILTERSQLVSGKLLTTNCYARKDRPYHPSDMFLVGTKATLDEYYPDSPFPTTELDDKLAIAADCRSGIDPMAIHQWPESRLFINLLKRRAWPLKNTQADSLEAIRRHCLVIDTRQIDLKWEKFYEGRFVLVPYQFTMPPFEGALVEVARCYTVFEIHGTRQIQSLITAFKTRLLWNDFFLAGRHYGSYWKGFRKVIKGQYKPY